MFNQITQKEDLEKLKKIRENIGSIVTISSKYLNKDLGKYRTSIEKFIKQIATANQSFETWHGLVTPFNSAIAEFNTFLEKLRESKDSTSPKNVEEFRSDIRDFLESTKKQIDSLIKKHEIKYGSERSNLTILIKSIKEDDFGNKVKGIIKNYLHGDKSNKLNFISLLSIKLRNREEEQFKQDNESKFLGIEKDYKEEKLFLTEEIEKNAKALKKETKKDKKADLLIFKEKLEEDKIKISDNFEFTADALRVTLGLTGNLYGEKGCYRKIVSSHGYSWHNCSWIREAFFTCGKPAPEKNLLINFFKGKNNFDEKFLKFIETYYSNTPQKNKFHLTPDSLSDIFFTDFLTSFLAHKTPYDLINDYASENEGSGGTRSFSADFSKYCIDTLPKYVIINLASKCVSLNLEMINPFLNDLKIDENLIIFLGIIIQVYFLSDILESLKTRILYKGTANSSVATSQLSPSRNFVSNVSKSPRIPSFFSQADDQTLLITPRTHDLVDKIVSENDTKELHLNFAKDYLRIIGETIDTLNLLKNFPENFAKTRTLLMTELEKHRSKISNLIENLNTPTGNNEIIPKSILGFQSFPALDLKRLSFS